MAVTIRRGLLDMTHIETEKIYLLPLFVRDRIVFTFMCTMPVLLPGTHSPEVERELQRHA